MRLLTAVLLCLSILSGVLWQPADATEPSLVRLVSASVCLVRLPDGSGSGTIVSQDATGFDILTCDHVVRPFRHATLEFPLAILSATVTAEDKSDDLALLHCSEPAPGDAASIPLAAANAAMGDEVFNIGCPMGLPMLATFGHVSTGELRDTPCGDGRLICDFPAVPGMSGSGMLDAAGHLVAVLEGHYPDTNVTIAIPVSMVRSFLHR